VCAGVEAMLPKFQNGVLMLMVNALRGRIEALFAK
jgi:hypothetical protein